MTADQVTLWMRRVRLWTGLGLIILLGIQIYTGFVITYKLPGFADYRTEYLIHTKFSWVLIFFFLTHASVNLVFLFRRWFAGREKIPTILLVLIYAASAVVSFYLIFFK